jgi:hypothetical protein
VLDMTQNCSKPGRRRPHIDKSALPWYKLPPSQYSDAKLDFK